VLYQRLSEVQDIFALEVSRLSTGAAARPEVDGSTSSRPSLGLSGSFRVGKPTLTDRTAMTRSAGSRRSIKSAMLLPSPACSGQASQARLFLLFMTVSVKFIINTFDFCADVLFVYRVKIGENEFGVVNAGYFYVIVCILIFFMKSVLRSITLRFAKSSLSLTKGRKTAEGLFIFCVLNFG
jgi:hypothetical protein